MNHINWRFQLEFVVVRRTLEFQRPRLVVVDVQRNLGIWNTSGGHVQGCMNFGRKYIGKFVWEWGTSYILLCLESCLLHLYLGKKVRILLNNLLIVTKLVTAQKWKYEIVPTISEWRHVSIGVINE